MLCKLRKNKAEVQNLLQPALPACLLAQADFRPGSKVQGPMNSSNLIGQKLQIGPKVFQRGSKTKSGKLRLNLHGTFFGGKINRLGPKNSAKRRAPDLENQESG